MEFLQTHAKEIFSLLVPLFAWFLNTRFSNRAKLQLAVPHQFTFLVDEPLKDAEGNVLRPKQTVHTESHVISNAGKMTATKVEVVFNWKPPCVNIWPIRHYQEFTEPDDRYSMIFDSLAPGEQVVFELMSINNELPKLVTARSDQCMANIIRMYPQPVAALWKQRLAVVLVFAGISFFIYVFIILLQFLIAAPKAGPI